MRRCLIAIFALHFFLSVSAFAFGDMPRAPGAPAHAATASQAATPAERSAALQEPGQDESSVNHALVDELPDLPDSLPRPTAVQRPPVDAARIIGYRQRAVLPPSLDGLLRPPQQATSAA